MTNDSEFLAEVKSRAEAAGLHALPGVAFSICSLDVPRLLAMIESRDEKLRVTERAFERITKAASNTGHCCYYSSISVEALAKIRGSDE